MGSHTTFPELFRVYDAIQVIVSTASRDNVPIWPDYAVAALTAAIPTCRLSEAELRDAVLDAALQAGVPVRTVSAATFPGSFRTGQTARRPVSRGVGQGACLRREDVGTHRRAFFVDALRCGRIVEHQQLALIAGPELDGLRMVGMEQVWELHDLLDALRVDHSRGVVVRRVAPSENEGRAVQGHGGPDQQEKIVAVEAHVADAEAIGF